MTTAADALKQVPLFESLSQRHLRRLAAKFRERQFKPGVTVVEEGKMSGIGFFIISEGEAAVSVDGKRIARLLPGDHFGELALIAGRERTATVTADTRLHCLEITAWDFRKFVNGNPDVSWKLLRYVVDLLLDADRRGPSASRVS
jgi:CRP-like cAMP-binding protein